MCPHAKAESWGRGSPHTSHSQMCSSVIFARGMVELSFCRQLYSLGAEIMGVGPFLLPLPYLLAQHAQSCTAGTSPHLPHPNSCHLGFSSLLWVWYLQSSRAVWHRQQHLAQRGPGGKIFPQGTPVRAYRVCWEEGSLWVRGHCLEPLRGCLSCCFLHAVHQDVRGGVAVPQGALCG